LASHTGSLPAKLPGLRWIPPPPGSDFDVSIVCFWVSPNMIQKGQFNLETQVQKSMARGHVGPIWPQEKPTPCRHAPLAQLHLTN